MPKVTDFSNAQIVGGPDGEDFDAVINGNQRIGKYEFIPKDKLTEKLLAIADYVTIAIKTTESGNIVNDTVLVKKDGTSISLRLYGVEKKLQEARTIKSDELKKYKFGYCKSDGQIVGNPSVDAGGKPCIVPVIYLHL